MQQHAATFFAQTEAAAGADLPQFVKDEFDAFLECGILAHGFLRLRCGRARMLIETSRMTIGQVAAQVGYEDATALRRLMRKAAGATPRKFRSAVHAA